MYLLPLLNMVEQKLATTKDVEGQALANSIQGTHHHVFQKVCKYEVRLNYQQLQSKNKII
jgi:hypothetical protein